MIIHESDFCNLNAIATEYHKNQKGCSCWCKLTLNSQEDPFFHYKKRKRDNMR